MQYHLRIEASQKGIRNPFTNELKHCRYRSVTCGASTVPAGQGCQLLSLAEPCKHALLLFLLLLLHLAAACFMVVVVFFFLALFLFFISLLLCSLLFLGVPSNCLAHTLQAEALHIWRMCADSDINLIHLDDAYASICRLFDCPTSSSSPQQQSHANSEGNIMLSEDSGAHETHVRDQLLSKAGQLLLKLQMHGSCQAFLLLGSMVHHAIRYSSHVSVPINILCLNWLSFHSLHSCG